MLDNPEFQDNEEVEVDNDLTGEEELFAALKSLKDSEFTDEEEESTDEASEIESDEELPEDELEIDEDEELEEDETEAEKGTKREQSREENARFAAQRRQDAIEKQVQERLESIKQEAPEYKLAKQLSDMYGVPVEEMITQMQENALQKEAEERNLPVELLRERQADKAELSNVQQQLNQMRFENWQSRIEADGAKLQTDYTMLNQDDMDAAVRYILHEAQNVDMPLEQAVYALHGKKIIDGLANAKIQDNLANEGGRKKKTPLAPNSGKTPSTGTLTAEESRMAKVFGMSDSDYLKYK
jgi:hypothetical protein